MGIPKAKWKSQIMTYFKGYFDNTVIQVSIVSVYQFAKFHQDKLYSKIYFIRNAILPFEAFEHFLNRFHSF